MCGWGGRWIRRQSRQHPAIASHVLIMLRQCCAEKMAALSVCNEIEKRRLRGSQRRPKRNLTGISNRTRRQTRTHIGIVRRVLVQISSAQSSAIAVLLLKSVNDRRIGLQQHTFFKAILKYSGDQGRFLRLLCFALTQRCKCDGRSRRPAARNAGLVRAQWRNV